MEDDTGVAPRAPAIKVLRGSPINKSGMHGRTHARARAREKLRSADGKLIPGSIAVSRRLQRDGDESRHFGEYRYTNYADNNSPAMLIADMKYTRI